MKTPHWEKMPPVKGGRRHCNMCPPTSETFHPESVIAVGLGSATLTKDGDTVFSEERDDENWFTGADAEKLALADPDHDWRISLIGPLSEKEYQRHGPGLWVLVRSGEGFA